MVTLLILYSHSVLQLILVLVVSQYSDMIQLSEPDQRYSCVSPGPKVPHPIHQQGLKCHILSQSALLAMLQYAFDVMPS